ncbi:MAG: 3-deoxy-D-manno-octulosonic acid transferase [Candidatus Omnitrophota bacterium]
MLYDIGFFIFSLFYLPTLLFKGKLHGDFAERFGIYGVEKKKALEAAKDAIWIQAVSVGEVAVCRKLIPSLRQRFPDRTIILSTITKTGNGLARKLFSPDAVVIYFPLDFSSVVKKSVAIIRPKTYIMVETEIWPNVLREMRFNSIPAILINGRISDRSFGKYKLVKPFLKNVLSKISLFCMQSATDAGRVVELGAPEERVSVTGNMKFDIALSSDTEAVRRLKEDIGFQEGDELIVAGSTHRGEEEMVVSAFKELAVGSPKLRLLIAPRHIERSAEVESVVRTAGFQAVKMSSRRGHPPAGNENPVFILDTIGLLNSAYSLAAVVFIGGSLVKHGGQNPIEPAVSGKPVVFGPHMFNFKDMTAALLKDGGAVQVQDAVGLTAALRDILKDENKRAALGNNAKEVIKRNCGATEKNLEILEKVVSYKL